MQNILFARKQMRCALKSAKYGRKYIYGDLREFKQNVTEHEIICDIWYLTTHIMKTCMLAMTFFLYSLKVTPCWNMIYIYIFFFFQALTIERIIVWRGAIRVIWYRSFDSCACVCVSIKIAATVIRNILRRFAPDEIYIRWLDCCYTLILSRSTGNVCCK